MSWFWLALLSALALATADLVTKRYFADLELPDIMLARFAGTLPVSLALLLIIPWPPLDGQFFFSLGLGMPALAAISFLYMRAIQISPLALTQPFLSFSPLFSLLPSLIMLNELPSWAGLAGVALLAAGAYGLNLHCLRAGWLQPLVAVAHEKGSWMVMLVSVLLGLTSVLARQGALHSSALFMGAVYPLVTAISVFLALACTGRLRWRWLGRPWPLLALAVCMACEIIPHYLAISQVQAPYMIAVKRTSPLLAVLWGAWFLGEGRLLQHLLACGLLVAGAVVVVLYG